MRHPKFRAEEWRDTPADQVRRLLGQLDVTTRAEVEEIPGTHAGRLIPWHRFRRHRSRGGGRRADGRGYGFRLTFAEPVQGAIAIGYGAHTGLGQFVAVE